MSHRSPGSLRALIIIAVGLAALCSGCRVRDAEPDASATTGPSAKSGRDSRDTAQPADPAARLRGRITIDGSSTVYLITQAVTEEFLKSHRQVRVTLGRAGTGGGFQRFDVDDLDICDASRPIEPEELEACRQNGVEYLELKIALDGLTVVVN